MRAVLSEEYLTAIAAVLGGRGPGREIVARKQQFHTRCSWRIEATGQAGKHQRLIVHRIHTRTAVTKHAEWYPAKELGGSVEFRPRKESPGTAVARYRIPGLLKVKPSVDGALTVTADVSVQADGRWERGMVKFRLDPNRKRQTESLFLPAELIKGIGSDPRDWDDPLWD